MAIPQERASARIIIIFSTTAFAVSIASHVRAQEQSWSPLISSGFGGELVQPWIPVPNGSSGAPRQGWLGTADGFFTREAHVAWTSTESDADDNDVGVVRLHYPFTRRLWAGLEVPFSNGIGDVTLNTQLMLAETQDLSLNAGIGWRLPTGDDEDGNGVFAVQPQLNLWTDIGAGFSFRGRVAYEFAEDGGTDSFLLNAAIGQTFTPHAAVPFGDFTWYIAASLRAPDEGDTFVSVTPGVRTHLGASTFMLLGVELPVTDKNESFDSRFTLQFVKGF